MQDSTSMLEIDTEFSKLESLAFKGEWDRKEHRRIAGLAYHEATESCTNVGEINDRLQLLCLVYTLIKAGPNMQEPAAERMREYALKYHNRDQYSASESKNE